MFVFNIVLHFYLEYDWTFLYFPNEDNEGQVEMDENLHRWAADATATASTA